MEMEIGKEEDREKTGLIGKLLHLVHTYMRKYMQFFDPYMEIHVNADFVDKEKMIIVVVTHPSDFG